METINYSMLERNLMDAEQKIGTAKMAEFTFIDEDGKLQNTLKYVTTRKEAGLALKWTYEQNKLFIEAMRRDLKDFIPDLSPESLECIITDIMNNVLNTPKELYYVANAKQWWRRRRMSPFDRFLFFFFRSCAWTIDREGKVFE